jgi:hypothetical protein
MGHKVGTRVSDGVSGETMTDKSISEQHESDGMAVPADGLSEADQIWTIMRRKTQELVASGIREGHARGLAQLEMRIAKWPSGWGDDLMVVIYGDFAPPHAELDFPDLGITI